MTDKFNKNNGPDDINDFFSKFDEIDTEIKIDPRPVDQTPKSTGTTATRASRSQKSRKTESEEPVKASRSKAKSKSKSSKTKKTHSSAAKSKKLRFLTTNSKGEPLSTKQKILRYALLAVIAVAIILFVYVGALILTADTHNIDADNIYSRLSQRSTLYDDSGNEIESVFSEDGNRDNVSYDQIPQNMVNAIVAIEDKTFWKHNGFNFIRMAGAIKDSIFGGGQISGTSTLTQQLARNIYLTETKSERSLNRKILEAYYAILIEKNLTKEQIVEAYLNTVYLGFNCYGVEAASQAYFGKSVTDLDLQECTALASLPKSPDSYALIKSYPIGSVEVDPDNILGTTSTMEYVYNGELSEPRRAQALYNMVDQGYISQAEADEAGSEDLRSKIHITSTTTGSYSSYFTDYAIDQAIQDIMKEYGWTEEDARNKIYTGGLKIYTTMDSNAQKIAVTELEDGSNLPGVTGVRKDSNGNIMNPASSGSILLYDYDDRFNGSSQFILGKDEYSMNSNGSMTLYANKWLKFYDITLSDGSSDVSIDFRAMYTQDGSKIYSIEGGALSVPQGYKTKDSNGNCIISAEFFTDYPSFFAAGENGQMLVNAGNYTLKQKVIQPQAAVVIMDYKTGGIKAMVGGRGVSGSMLYNRAINPRQPGSTIKPLSVYSAALQYSFNAEKNGETLKLTTSDGSNWGKYITAGSVINDAPMTVNGRTWPRNFSRSYSGHMTLRTALENSINTCAVKTYQQMGPEFPVEQLKKFGVTTVVEDSDGANDMNPAALALGGMTKGISPLEMCAAYGTFPNEGIRTEPIAYTKITNSNDEIILEKTAETTEVLDKGVAFIMTDMLRSVVTHGIGSTAGFRGQPVAGKTGTTTDNFDAWFCGFTPQYSCAVWIGNDINIELTQGSAAAARLWRTIMSQVCEGLPYGQYPSKPSNVESVNGEYYTQGTYYKVALPTSEAETSSEAPTTTEPTAPSATETPANPTSPTTSTPADQPATQRLDEDDD